MNRVLKLVNHSSTQEQIKQLQDEWNITEIIELPSDLALSFSNVSPEELDLKPVAIKFIRWIENQGLGANELVWIQGETGLSFLITQKLLANGFTVIHATTKRVVIEDESVKKSIFRHQLFRKFQLL